MADSTEKTNRYIDMKEEGHYVTPTAMEGETPESPEVIETYLEQEAKKAELVTGMTASSIEDADRLITDKNFVKVKKVQMDALQARLSDLNNKYDNKHEKISSVATNEEVLREERERLVFRNLIKIEAQNNKEFSDAFLNTLDTMESSTVPDVKAAYKSLLNGSINNGEQVIKWDFIDKESPVESSSSTPNQDEQRKKIEINTETFINMNKEERVRLLMKKSAELIDEKNQNDAVTEIFHQATPAELSEMDLGESETASRVHEIITEQSDKGISGTSNFRNVLEDSVDPSRMWNGNVEVMRIMSEKYNIADQEVRPTLEAYLLSRGIPYNRLEITTVDYEASENYVNSRLTERFEDDDIYNEADKRIQELSMILDQKWENHEPISETLAEISKANLIRHSTTRGFYSEIKENLERNKESIEEKNSRIEAYNKQYQKMIESTLLEMEERSPYQIQQDIEDFINLNQQLDEVSIANARAFAETIAQMEHQGRMFDNTHLRELAAYYYQSLRMGKYREENDRYPLMSPMVFTGASSENEELVASVIPLRNTSGRSFNSFSPGKYYFATSLEYRIVNASHEGTHAIDCDTLGFPAEEGEDNFAFRVSTEAVAHLNGLKTYIELKKIYPNLVLPKYDEFATMLKQRGIDSVLRYGLHYINREN